MSSLFSHIAVAVDDSEPSERALAFAIRAATQYEGKLTCINGVDWASAVSTLEAGLSTEDPTPVVDALRTEGKAALAKACAQARAAGLACDEQLIEDKPADAILIASKNVDALVIVLGTHGRSGLGRVVLGSVTEAVTRSSHVPVLAVHPTSELPAAGQPLFQKILVAVDEHEPSDAAVHIAVALLPKDGHQITFCTVVSEPSEAATARAQLTLDRAMEYAREYKVTADSCMVGGKPAETVVAEATKRQCDLIVVGTHGRKGFERIFSGSVAESVLHAAKVPVLVVHG